MPLRYLLLALFSITAAAQIPAPQLPLTGNIGCAGFPCLNNGTLIMAADADRTMTAQETSALYIKVTSSVSLTAQRNLIAPAGNFPFTIENATTGGQSIQIIGVSGTGVTIPDGQTVSVWNDGTNFVSSGGGSSSYPGVTSDGSNGLDITGGLTLQNGQNVYPQSQYSYLFDAGASFDGQACAGTIAAQCWPAVASASFSGQPVSVAVGGAQMADIAVLQVAPNVSPTYSQTNPLVIIDPSLNDAFVCGVSAGCEANFSAALYFAIAWAEIPNEQTIFFGSNTQVVNTSGTANAWTQDSTLGTNVALACNTAPCSLTFTPLSSSQPLYLGWMAYSTGSGSATYSCNGGSITGTMQAFGFNGQTVATQNGGTYSGFGQRLAANITSCSVTVNTAPFSMVVAKNWTPPTPSTFASIAFNAPRVGVMGEAYRTGTSPPDSQIAAYDVIEYNIEQVFQNDGMYVQYIPLRQPAANGVTGPLNSTTDYSTSNVTLPDMTVCTASLQVGHPNKCGEMHMAVAVLKAFTPNSAGFTWPLAPTPSTAATCNPAATPITASNQIIPCLNFFHAGDYTFGEGLYSTAAGTPFKTRYVNWQPRGPDFDGWDMLSYSAASPLSSGTQLDSGYHFPPLPGGVIQTGGWAYLPASLDQFTSSDTASGISVNTFGSGLALFTTTVSNAPTSFTDVITLGRDSSGNYFDYLVGTSNHQGVDIAEYVGGTPCSAPSCLTSNHYINYFNGIASMDVLQLNNAVTPATGDIVTIGGVQSGHPYGVDSQINLVNTVAQLCADTSGSPTAQSCQTAVSFTPSQNSCIIYTTTTANSGTSLTINVDSSANEHVAKWLGIGSHSTVLAAGDLPANAPQLMCFDGTNWNASTIGNPPSSGVSSIAASASATGAITFTGSGVSQSGNTFTFSGTGGGPAISTNGTANGSQTVLNFLTSTTNSVGLTATPVYSATGNERFEITGSSYGGNAATASAAPLSGITGLGSGVGTALAIAVGSAGGPVTNGSALGTPSGGVITNLTGTCASCGSSTAVNISTNGTANQVWGMNSGATAQGWQTVSGGGSSALSGITAATASNTIANGNNPQTWNWAQTTGSQTAFKFGETTAATGTGDLELAVTTLAGSTAVPFTVTNSLTGSQVLSSLQVLPTWNTSGVVDAGILENVTNTASGTGSKMLDLQVTGSTRFNVTVAGDMMVYDRATIGVPFTNTGLVTFGNGGSANTLTLGAAVQTTGNSTLNAPNLAGTTDTIETLGLAQTITAAKTFSGQIIPGGSAPTCAVGSAAGSGATCSITGVNQSGHVTVNTGTSTLASNTLVTITFNGGPLSVAPYNCGLTSGNVNATGQVAMIYSTTPSTTTWTIAVSGTAVPASTSGFTWGYTCI